MGCAWGSGRSPGGGGNRGAGGAKVDGGIAWSAAGGWELAVRGVYGAEVGLVGLDEAGGEGCEVELALEFAGGPGGGGRVAAGEAAGSTDGLDGLQNGRVLLCGLFGAGSLDR